MNNSTSFKTEGFAYIPITSISMKIIYYIIYAFIIFVGTSGNSMVIYAVGVKKRADRKMNSCDVYIISLAIADLLSSIFIPPLILYYIYTDHKGWHLFGEVGCKLFGGPMISLSTLVSSLMLVVISLKRKQ